MSFNEIFPNYPKGWRSLTLGELAKENGGSIQTGPFGSQLHASDYVECGIPSIMPKNISVDGVLKNDIAQIKPEDAERLEKYRVRLGDIVYSRRGDVEKCCLITKKEDGWLCGTGCLRVRIPADNLLQQYVHAYLCHPAVRSWVVRHAIGATMPNLNTSILSALPVLIPAAKEIQRIVEIWSAVSEKITLNTQINQTLEQMAQALFKSWFVDFEPVIDNALDAGNPIPEPLAERAARRKAMWAAGCESAPARLPTEIRRLFPDRFEEDETLGWVPVGWGGSQIGSEFHVVMGQSPPGSSYNSDESGLPFFQGRGEFGFRYPKKRLYCSEPKRLAEAGSTLISVRAPVGDVNMAIEKYCIGRGLAALLHKSNCAGYTYYLIGSLYPEFKIFDSEGTVFGSINQKNLKRMACIAPSQELVKSFEKSVSPLDSEILNLSQNNISLAQLRDTLLPKLLSGELQLPEAEAAVDTALEVEPA